MCDDKDVQRLTFDSYLYKRVVAMNPWQQIKLTVLTLGAILRGQALAPSGYRPVHSAVRSDEEMERMRRSAGTGGAAPKAAATGGPGSAPTPPSAAAEEREPVLAGKG
jgi:geranylgeranyl reductase